MKSSFCFFYKNLECDEHGILWCQYFIDSLYQAVLSRIFMYSKIAVLVNESLVKHGKYWVQKLTEQCINLIFFKSEIKSIELFNYLVKNK